MSDRPALVESLESRLLLTVPIPVYEFIGADTWSPPPGTEYTATGNRGDHFWAEPGVTPTHPTSGFHFGHPSGSSTSFSIEDLPKHTELRLDMGWDADVQGLIPIGPGGETEPTGYWEAVMEFGPYEHWWRTDGSGDGGDPLTFAWHEDWIDVTITATWHGEMVSAANWLLGEATVERWTPVVTMIPVDTAVEGKDDYLPGQEPGFIISREGDQLLSALVVALADEDGTANPDEDYGTLPTFATIPQGSGSVFVPLNVINGNDKEWTETVEYELGEMEDGRYVLPNPPTAAMPIFATAHIKDDDGVDIHVEGLPDDTEDEEYNEVTPGLVLAINDDDDNGDSTPDWLEPPVFGVEDDLEEVKLRFPDELKSVAGEAAEVWLELDSYDFRVWTQTGQLLLGGSSGVLSILLDHVELGPEMTVYIEALRPPEPIATHLPTSGNLWLYGEDVGARATTTFDRLVLVGVEVKVDLDDPTLTPDQEQRYGTFVMINADNDNGSPVAQMWPDKRDFEEEDGATYAQGGLEDDLKELLVIVKGATGPVDVKLSWESAKVRIYRSSDKTSRVSSGDSLSVTAGQASIYVEGVQLSTELKDFELTAQLLDGGDPVPQALGRLTGCVGPIAQSGKFLDDGEPKLDPALEHTARLNAYIGQPFGEGFPPSSTALKWQYEAAFHPTLSLDALKFVQTTTNEQLLEPGVGVLTSTGVRWKCDFGSIGGVNYAGQWLIDSRPPNVPFYITQNPPVGLGIGRYSVDADSDGELDTIRCVEGDSPLLPMEPLGLEVGDSASVHIRWAFELHFVLDLDGVIYPLMKQEWEVEFHGTLNRVEPERYQWTTPEQGSHNHSGALGDAVKSTAKPRAMGPVIANEALMGVNGGGLIQVVT